MVENLVLVGQDCQRSVVAHRAYSLSTFLSHYRGEHPNLFDGVAKGLLQTHEFANVQGWKFRCYRQIFERNFVVFQPLAVWILSGQVVLQFFVVDYPALL